MPIERCIKSKTCVYFLLTSAEQMKKEARMDVGETEKKSMSKIRVEQVK